jgi:asparagine synthase (glutamine-hydrolysing)
MCGIAGILSFSQAPVDERRLDAMARAIAPRGPDGNGRLSLSNCHLLHSRLSIVDLAGGAQPMRLSRCPRCSDLAIVFNGEIYNHRDLRRELVSAGHAFETDHSDTEVLLHGYAQWGLSLLEKIEGMFALALWDQSRQTLLLTRDHTGKKPLWTRWTGEGNRRTFAFASLVSALVTGTSGAASPAIDAQALSVYLQLGYTFERSLLSGVSEVPAGSWTLIDATGKQMRGSYWRPISPDNSSASSTTSLQDANALADQVQPLLRRAVASRLDADVPVGCFLSSGIDSSLIASLATTILRERGEPALRTFTVAMPDASFDESTAAAQIAAALGTNHTTLHANSGTDVLSQLASLIAHTGEPTGDSSILPTLWVSQATRQHVKVALSGDGGDELFAGYDRYRAMTMLARHGSLLRKIPASLVPHRGGRSRVGRLRRLLDAANTNTAAQSYQRLVGLFDFQQCRALGIDSPFDPMVAWADSLPPSDAARAWDVRQYLPFDLLRKVDRASMSVALEVRCPLLDREICRWAMGRSAATLSPQGVGKAVLRQLVERVLGPNIAHLPKRGFGVPIGSWMTTTLRDGVRDRLLDGTLRDAGLDLSVVHGYWNEHATGRADHTHRLFALLTLSMWLSWRRSVSSNG